MTIGVPLCTIAIPVYHRREKALAFAAIDSALAESRADVEILVIDDCTTDGTWDRLALIRDARVRILRNDRNVGLFANFNRCLDEARGRYVRILCSDDILEPGTLDAELAVMEAHPEVALLSTRGLRVASGGAVIGLQAAALPEGCYKGAKSIGAVLRANAGTGYNSLNYPSGILLRRAASDGAGRFRTDMQMSGDVEYFLRILQVGGLAVLNRVGCRITVHADQVGARLSLKPEVMQELFDLLGAYGGRLDDDTTRHRVRRSLGGLSVWQALRSTLALDVRTAVSQLGVARRNGVGALGMTLGLALLLVRRARWSLRGPFVPGGVAPDSPL